jgi:hypothetical protein
MRLKELKDLIKKSMVEVAPKKDSGAMNPEEEENAAAAMAAINRYEKEKKEMDLTSGPTVVPGAVPMREGSNIPDDIEWEWDGQVLDQVDSYSAEIGLEGYSPSTGHSFTASVPAYDNGGDWEWNEGDIDFIEQAPMEEGILREADKIVAAYAEKKTLKEEMHGGYLELMEMNPKFDEGVAMLLDVWEEWKSGEMTEPEMIDEAKQDILAYLSSMMN